MPPLVFVSPDSLYWLIRMSCRIAVTMAKRAAAGAISASTWSDEENAGPFQPAVIDLAVPAAYFA
jgi:hypothetical protein